MSELTGARILVVDDEPELMQVLQEALTGQGCWVTGVLSAEAALAALPDGPYDLVLTDLMMPGVDGLELLRRAQQFDPFLVGIVMTGQGTLPTAIEALQIGAQDYLLKPFRLNTLLPTLTRALRLRRLRLENDRLQANLRDMNWRLNYLLHRLAPPAVADHLVAEGQLPSLEGQRRTATVLFADMRGYSAVAESLEPEAVLAVLNWHFALAGRSVAAHGGTIVQYAGDMLEAIFNGPEDQPDHAAQAVRAAQAIRAELARLRAEPAGIDAPAVAHFGFGVATGPLVVGYRGFDARFEYAVVGDVVNIAFRLSAAAHQDQILIGPGTQALVADRLAVRSVGPLAMKNRSQPIEAYEVLKD